MSSSVWGYLVLKNVEDPWSKICTAQEKTLTVTVEKYPKKKKKVSVYLWHNFVLVSPV